MENSRDHVVQLMKLEDGPIRELPRLPEFPRRPFSIQIIFLVGVNNTGKSFLLAALKSYLSEIKQKMEHELGLRRNIELLHLHFVHSAGQHFQNLSPHETENDFHECNHFNSKRNPFLQESPNQSYQSDQSNFYSLFENPNVRKLCMLYGKDIEVKQIDPP